MAEVSRAVLRKLNLENIEREQKREEESWRLGEEDLWRLSATFESVQTEYHDLDGLVWSSSDTRLSGYPTKRPRYTSMPSSPSPKSIHYAFPHAKPMSPLTNCPLPPVPPSSSSLRHRSGKRERSPVKGLFDNRPPSPIILSTSTSRDSMQGTIRPKTSAGRGRDRNRTSPPSKIPSIFPRAATNKEIPSRKLIVRQSLQSGRTTSLTFETPRSSDSSVLDNHMQTDVDDIDPDATLICMRPSSSLGFVDGGNIEDDDFDDERFDTIRPSSKVATAMGLGLGIPLK